MIRPGALDEVSNWLPDGQVAAKEKYGRVLKRNNRRFHRSLWPVGMTESFGYGNNRALRGVWRLSSPPGVAGHDSFHEFVEERNGECCLSVGLAPDHAFADEAGTGRR